MEWSKTRPLKNYKFKTTMLKIEIMCSVLQERKGICLLNFSPEVKSIYEHVTVRLWGTSLVRVKNEPKNSSVKELHFCMIILGPHACGDIQIPIQQFRWEELSHPSCTGYIPDMHLLTTSYYCKRKVSFKIIKFKKILI